MSGEVEGSRADSKALRAEVGSLQDALAATQVQLAVLESAWAGKESQYDGLVNEGTLLVSHDWQLQLDEKEAMVADADARCATMKRELSDSSRAKHALLRRCQKLEEAAASRAHAESDAMHQSSTDMAYLFDVVSHFEEELAVSDGRDDERDGLRERCEAAEARASGLEGQLASAQEMYLAVQREQQRLKRTVAAMTDQLALVSSGGQLGGDLVQDLSGDGAEELSEMIDMQ
jgi:chromosome segregation ATPase